MSPDNEVRPRFPEGDDVNANGWRATPMVSDPVAHLTVDGQVMTARDWQVWHDGWTYGRTEGIEAGREEMEAELAAIQSAAVASVRAAVTLPPRDAAADRAAAEKRAARWSQ